MPIPVDTPSFERSSIGERIYESLRQWIVEGTLEPGETLKDSELADRLGVSRTPVREALCRLRDEGLVHISASKWTKVAEVSPEDIDRLVAIVSCLEVLALEQAFPGLDQAQLARMRQVNQSLRQALLTGRFEDAAEANRVFHGIIVEGSRNPELVDIIKRVKSKTRRLGTYYFRSHNIVPSSAIEEHEALIAAIADGDLEEGKRLLSWHWDQVVARLRRAARNDESYGTGTSETSGEG
jgi:DNA-binding GntR family transcriptional regulator